MWAVLPYSCFPGFFCLPEGDGKSTGFRFSAGSFGGFATVKFGVGVRCDAAMYTTLSELLYSEEHVHDRLERNVHDYVQRDECTDAAYLH